MRIICKLFGCWVVPSADPEDGYRCNWCGAEFGSWIREWAGKRAVRRFFDWDARRAREKELSKW